MMGAVVQRVSSLVDTVPASKAVALSGWALLTVDGITLALPQKEVVTIELASTLQAVQSEDKAEGNVMGWLARARARWPVYCLDRHCMTVPASSPGLKEAVRVCVLLRAGDRFFGLAGVQVSLLATDADLAVQPLPTCMVRPGTPIVGLALRQGELVICMSALALADYLLPGEKIK